MDMILEYYLEAMSEASGLCGLTIINRSRKRDHCAARNIIMHRLFHHDKWSLSRIGRAFNRDHNTVSNGIKNVELYKSVPTYEEQRIMLDDFERIINNKSNEI